MLPGTAGGSAGSAKKTRKERTITCTYCPLTFNKKEHAVRHERTHTLDRPYICDFPECGKTFARRDTLTRHTRLHKREDTSPAPEAGAHPSSSSSSLAVPRPARKRRARHGSANSTLVHGDSTDDPTSSSPENDDEELDHKAPVAKHAEKAGQDAGSDREAVEADIKPFIAAPALSRTSSYASASLPYDFNNVSQALPKHSPTAPFVAPINVPSALGLDIALPPAATSPTFAAPALPAFVQATRDHFRNFRPSFSTSSTATATTPKPTTEQLQFQFQQQQRAALQQHSSFLAGHSGRSNFAQFSQLDPLAVAAAHANQQQQQQLLHQGQGSQDYAPYDDIASNYSASPSWAGSDNLSLVYSDSPTSDTSSLPPLSSSMPQQPSKEDYAYYYGDTDISAFKNKEAFYQPMTMSIGLPTRKGSVDYDSKNHLYMLMSATETPTDEYLRWPSRTSSPAAGHPFSGSHSRQTSNDTELSSSMPSDSASSGSSFLDFHEYDSTRCSLFGDKMMAGAGPQSPIASLADWLVRQSGEPSDMVF